MALPVVLLFGPTASGKTEALRRLFGASGPFPGEVVSADSMQVYRGMDVGTAKPGADLLAELPHRLIDIRDPDEPFNVGDFVRLADGACAAVAASGRVPVVSGGTAFYFKHFIEGLPEAPPSDPDVREALRREAEEGGVARLHAELSRADPATAARVHPNDAYRVLRALEVCRSSGRPLSSFAARGSGSEGRPEYRFLALGIERERAELYRRIDARAAAMFAAGLPAEVDRLVASGYGPGDPAFRAIGYREFFGPDGDRLRDEAAVMAAVAQDSRRYAKRQATFFAAIPGTRRVLFQGDGIPLDELRREIGTFLERP